MSELERGVAEALGFLDAHEGELVEFASALIATPSMNGPNNEPPGDERAVAALIQERFAELGLPRGEVLAKRPERPNVLLRIKGGRPGPVLLYNAHTDTKPVGEDARPKWLSDPLKPTIREGKMYGLGASDMKAAVASMVYAAAALAPLADSLAGELLLVLSADEESGGNLGPRYLVSECGLKADVVLIGEPNGVHSSFEYISLVSRGVCCFRIKVYGTQMHSSLSDRLPSVNASANMAYVLWRLSKEFKVRYPPHPLCPQGPTINVGVSVRGGVTYGVFPGYAEFGTDIRTLPGMSFESVKADLEAFLAGLRKEKPDLKWELEFEPPPLGWLTPTEIPADTPLVGSVQRACQRVLGSVPPLGTFPGGTDAVSFQGLGGIPTIPAFGPGLLPLAHGPNEYVAVADLLKASKIYLLAAADYLGGRADG